MEEGNDADDNSAHRTEQRMAPENVGSAVIGECPLEVNETNKKISMLKYLKAELTRGYLLEHEEEKFSEKRRRVYTFMKTPRELETFLVYGFFLCVDAFLHVLTFLPLRFMLGIFKIVTQPCGFMFGRSRVLEPGEICDILKVLILIIVCVAVSYVDTSMMYHIIRGQAIIKLYIFFNMLEIADKLFSSFGQDILDSLFWTATEPRSRRREHVGVIPHLLLACLYVFLHTILVLLQTTTLNVAFNSHNKSLLTIMMSNNFVEVKGTVFRKFDKNNLFQMSCADVRERFHYIILLSMVFVRNMAEFSWNIDHFWLLIPDMIMVLLAEVVVDWVKHAFITKFNAIASEVYREYKISLAYDMANSKLKKAVSDHTDQVSRRMGFIPFPLTCLMIKMIYTSIKFAGAIDIIILILIYFGLITFKVFNSIVLLGHAIDCIKEQKARAEQESKSKTSTDPKDEVIPPAPSSPDIRRALFQIGKGSLSEDHASILRKRTNSGTHGSQPNVTFASFVDDIEPEPRSRSMSLQHVEHKHAHEQSSLAEGLKSSFTEDLLNVSQSSEDVSSFDQTEDLPTDMSSSFHPEKSLTAMKPMFSNSMVSLKSVHLNEEFLKDSEAAEAAENECSEDAVPKEGKPEETGVADPTLDAVEKTKTNKTLNEIDRFTMCSSSIV
ncbi:transmembrane anterior posterior transformation protein 1 homolog [Lingula anatina]|uniref:Transmembrane anterior posterior transformation protein 1 homolog n=1 Tax=Lingula anatina TaxID=7574 RepID=A0A1S3GYH5_LINAN|nr:transmembrane anterior posterior transformation protein 1 homolog [Lingula anatina]|eukprot:XP_013378717.1 transmembrane anterior posterior transformation protein 1 homolog [Lingula anatina]